MSNQEFKTPQDALIHFGVKGQKWGVVKKDTPGEKQGMSTKKKVAIGVGAGVVVAGAAFAAVYLAKNGKNPIAEIKELVQEPTSMIHATRGKNRGFNFRTAGGLKDPLTEYVKTGFEQMPDAKEFFNRYGDRMEKVAARFPDPLGRKDAAGRVIPHEVILHEALAKGVKDVADAIKVAWPSIADEYADYYNSTLERRT